MGLTNKQLPKIGFLYLDYVLRFFDHSNFKGWPNKIETVTYHWKNDKARFIKEVKRKGIDVLIGNVPATAYETFREIARALPNVRFIPSLDTQFSNKSKLKTCFTMQVYYAVIFSSKLNSFSTKYSTLVFLNSFALNRILYSSTSICF